MVATARERCPGAAVTTPVPRTSTPPCAKRSAAAGIDTLWSHQADTLESARRGPHDRHHRHGERQVARLQPAVLDTLAADPAARAFYLYPTKALAQDQARKLAELGGRFLRHAIYDGDTPREERRRDPPALQPDPHQPGHAARGRAARTTAAGATCSPTSPGSWSTRPTSTAACSARTWRTCCAGCGGSPAPTAPSRASCSRARRSPTRSSWPSGSPALDFALVDRDGAPHAERADRDVEPAARGRAARQARARPCREAAKLLADLVAARRAHDLLPEVAPRRGADPALRARCGSRTRAAPTWPSGSRPTAPATRPTQRREIERRLAEGELLAVVATDALELGIDIGDLDAAICVTFPGTVASLRQMWGRAGRRAPGLAMYVAGEDALDQFFCRHPDEFLDRPVERAILDHESEEIHLAHLAAAAYELPLTPEDEDVFGAALGGRTRGGSCEQGRLRERGGRYLPRGPGYPAAAIALRSASPDSVAIVEAVGRRADRHASRRRARHSAVHPGAVYLHMGAAYEVEDLDLAQRRALVAPVPGRLVHAAEEGVGDLHRGGARAARRAAAWTLSFGVVSVTEQVVAYQRKRVTDHRVLDLLALDLPEQDFVTQALWYELPDALLREEFPLDVLQGSLHAAEHGADRGAAADRDVRPLGHRRPLDRLPPPDRPRRRSSSTTATPAASGITRAGYERFERLVDDALRLISECPCQRRLPVLRAVAEVRQPQRAAEQARRDRAAQPDGAR